MKYNKLLKYIAVVMFIAVFLLQILCSYTGVKAVETSSQNETSSEKSTEAGKETESSTHKEETSTKKETESSSKESTTEKSTKAVTSSSSSTETTKNNKNSVSILAANGYPGETLPVTVTIVGPIAKGATVKLTYDKDNLTYKTITGGKTTDGQTITVAASTEDTHRVTVELELSKDVETGDQLPISVSVAIIGGNTYKDNDSIVVTKKKEEEYTLPPNYGAGTNPQLESLKVTGYKLSPAFDEDVTVYRLEVGKTVKSVDVIAECDDSMSCRVTGASNLAYGENVVKVTVTSSSGLTKTYTILVTRDGSEEETKESKKETTAAVTDEVRDGDLTVGNEASKGSVKMWVVFLLLIVSFFAGFIVCYAVFVGFKDVYYDDED